MADIDGLTMVQAVTERLRADAKGAAVAVVDAHGELVAFARSAGCPLPSIANATNKAFTAAREGVPSAEVGRRSREEGWPLTNFGDLRYTGWGGGVPIVAAGEVVGAVGVSGLPEDEDVALAEWAAAQVT